MKTLRLFTTHYPEPDPARRAEYAECLSRNLGCEAIAEVRVLVEGGADTDLPESPKLFTRPISARPTYADFFAWINEIAGSDDISLVANSDIFFDGSMRMAEALVTRDRCLALSRWDVLKGGRKRLYECGDSQDCWIFQGPVRSANGNFPLGVYDCDNKIAWELREAGCEVVNPAFSLRSYHLHQGAVRSYDPTNPPDYGIRPPFLYVEPDNAGTLLECCRLWREHSPGYFPWRFTWKKFLRTRAGRPFRYLVYGVARRLGRGAP